jgi:hypothetical protein
VDQFIQNTILLDLDCLYPVAVAAGELIHPYNQLKNAIVAVHRIPVLLIRQDGYLLRRVDLVVAGGFGVFEPGE